MSTESGLRVRIDYEDVAALKDEVKVLSTRLEVLSENMEDMSDSMKGVAESSKKSAKSLSLIAKIKKLELVGYMNDLYKTMLNMGRASPLLASNMAVLEWQMDQIGIVIGDALAPIVETLSNGLQVLIDAWEDLDQPTKDAIFYGIQVAGVMGVVAGAMIFLQSSMAPIILTVLIIVGGVTLLITIFDKFGIVGLLLAATVGILAIAFIFLNTSLAPVYAIIGLIIIIVVTLMLIWQEFGDEIMAVIEVAIGFVILYIEMWMAIIQTAIDFITIGFQLIVDIVMNMVNSWMSVFDAFADFFSNVFTDPVGAVQTLFSDLVGIVIGYFSNLIDIISTAGGDLISSLVEGAISAVGNLFGGVIDAIMEFWPFSPAKKGPFSGTGMADIGWSFVKVLVDGMVTAVNTLAPEAFNALLDAIPSGIDAGAGLVEEIGQGIADGVGSVGDGLGGLIDEYLPFSPAKKGPFSGTRLKDSGAGIIKEMGKGMELTLPKVIPPALDYFTTDGSRNKTTNNNTYNIVINSNVPGTNGFQQGRGLGEGLTQKLRSKGLR